MALTVKEQEMIADLLDKLDYKELQELQEQVEHEIMLAERSHEEGYENIHTKGKKIKWEIKTFFPTSQMKVQKLGSKGSGWHKEPVSHSYATKFGKAPKHVRGR